MNHRSGTADPITSHRITTPDEQRRSATPDDDATAPLPAQEPNGATAENAASEPPERIGPSLPQVAGSAAAAVSAALVSSRLGVAGTLTGAAIVSIVSTVAAAYYTNIADRTNAQVRRLGSASARRLVRSGRGSRRSARETGGAGARLAGSAYRRPVAGLRRWWVGAVAAFALAVGGLTVLELGLGHPVSATDSTDTGTSIGSVVGGTARDLAPASPTTTPESTRQPTQAPTTGGGEPAPTRTGEASATATPDEPSATPTRPATTGAPTRSTGAAPSATAVPTTVSP